MTATVSPEMQHLHDPGPTPTSRSIVDRRGLRLAAALVAIGELVFLVSGLFHPDHAHANNHKAVFAEYAASSHWTLVHVGQFVGTALVLGGLLTLLVALGIPERSRGWLLTRLTAASAVVSLALYAVLQAVDGVALKQAVDAWIDAPLAEKAAAFRAAEAIRWLEWGVRGFEQLMFGLSLILLAGVVVWTRRLPRTLGYLAAVSGVAYVIQAYLLSTEGFSTRGSLPGLLALAFGLAWVIVLVISAWRPARG